MGKLRLSPGGGGGDLDVITAGAADVVAPKVIVDKDGEPVVGTMPDRGAWVGSVGMNGSIAVPDGKHKASKVNGPVVTQRGQWTGRIGVNGKAVIPEGYHNGAGYVDQAINNRGSLAKTLAINETFWLPEGYYSGGYVNQGIPTYGDLAYTPNKSTQVAYVAGRYMTGNVTIHPIPANYYDVNSNQLLFKNGSFGTLANAGARFSDGSANPTLGDEASIVDGNLRITTPNNAHGISGRSKYLRFKRAIPIKQFSRLRIVALSHGIGDFKVELRDTSWNYSNVWWSWIGGSPVYESNLDLQRAKDKLGNPDTCSLHFMCLSSAGGAWFEIMEIELIK